MVSTQQQIDTLRTLCHKHAKNASGTSYIFEQRAARLKQLTFMLKVIGLLLPALVGYIVLNFGSITQPQHQEDLALLINIAATIGLVQFIGSVWAIAANWDDRLAYYAEAMVANRDLREDFEALAKRSVNDLQEFEQGLQILEERRKQRDQQDSKYSPSEKERRKGMRYALRLAQATCAGCQKVPVTMEPSDCQICGKF